ncbi:hypothetical protein NDU88_001922 [Pleurodeles waltl]|uniref:Uncharacterized protein n=1 Tax=Pleurodeles waltl TaxID=8319 RepID=A0AAV7T139_PLEWA|nr:hypothetical protein NDU88_001922 [Pleurodeles waltl]
MGGWVPRSAGGRCENERPPGEVGGEQGSGGGGGLLAPWGKRSIEERQVRPFGKGRGWRVCVAGAAQKGDKESLLQPPPLEAGEPCGAEIRRRGGGRSEEF